MQCHRFLDRCQEVWLAILLYKAKFSPSEQEPWKRSSVTPPETEPFDLAEQLHWPRGEGSRRE